MLHTAHTSHITEVITTPFTKTHSFIISQPYNISIISSHMSRTCKNQNKPDEQNSALLIGPKAVRRCKGCRFIGCLDQIFKRISRAKRKRKHSMGFRHISFRHGVVTCCYCVRHVKSPTGQVFESVFDSFC